MNWKRTLALDLSSPEGSLAIDSDEIFLGGQHQHTERVIPALDELLQRNRITLSELTAVLVNQGPGSFTGLRVAFATGKALAQSLSIPLFTVHGAEARAIAYWESHGGNEPLVVLTALTREKFLVHPLKPGGEVGEGTVSSREQIGLQLKESAGKILVDTVTAALFPGEGYALGSRARGLLLAAQKGRSLKQYATAEEWIRAAPDYPGTARFQTILTAPTSAADGESRGKGQ